MKYNEETKLFVNRPYYIKSDPEENSFSNQSNHKKYISIIITSLIIFLFFIIYIFHKKNISLNESQKNLLSSSSMNQTLFQELNSILNNFESSTWPTSQNVSQSLINPKFSVIIPVYNSAKKIKITLRSIQYQNVSDIEIILIDDNSEDNTIEIIDQLQKEDTRIKLLKNKNNKGILYTRSIGVFNSKGKYIFQINSGDVFINNIFNICYQNAELNDIDIIEFSGYNISEYSISTPDLLKNKENNKIIFQPELSNIMYKEIINKSYVINDGLIWGKFIKKEIYKNSIDMLNFVIFTEKVFFFEDKIINFGLFLKANSFQFINIKGIIHNSKKNFNHKNKNQFFCDYLKYSMSIFKLTQNSNNVKIAVFEFINVINLYSKELNEEYKKNFIALYKEIKECNNVNEDNKKYIEIKLKEILNKERELNIYKNLFE